MMHVVSLANTVPQPWRNGGGSTQELLAWPSAPHPATDWLCRISVARIDKSGPFSAFPGVERWFTVLSGEGVVLRLPARRVMLGAGSEPLRFDGAAAPGCDLLDGPTQDLNLMLRSDSGRGGMVQAPFHTPWQSPARLRALFTLAACTLQVDGQAPLELAAGSLVWADDAALQTWVLQPSTAAPESAGAGAGAAARAWWLHFNPFPSSSQP